MLWSATLLACGSRSQLLGGAGDEIGGAGGAFTVAGSSATGFGGSFVPGGTSPMGGFGSSFGGAPIGGKTFGGAGGFAGLAGEPNVGQAGEGGGPVGPGEVLWGKRFGDEQAQQRINALAVEPDGTFTITGGLRGAADFGTGPVGDSADLDFFLAQFNGDGSPRWDKLWSNGGNQEARGVAIAKDGLISVVGSFSGTLDFGAPLSSRGSEDAFLLSFDQDGSYRHGARFGDDDDQIAAGVAVASAGQPIWAGSFRGKLDFEDYVVTSSGSVDAIVAGFDRELAHQWDVEAGNQLAQRANAIAHAAADNTFLVAGELEGSLKLGACSPLTSAGGTDAWVGWLDLAGNCLHSLRFGDASIRPRAANESNQAARAVATGKSPLSNLVAVVGDFGGSLEAGGHSLEAADDADVFVLLLSVDRGAQRLVPQWARRIGGSGAQAATGVAFDAQDNLIVVGTYSGDVNDPPLKPLGDGQPNAFVVKYDSGGAVLWTKSLGDDDDQAALAVDTDAAGNVYVAGKFSGRIPLATGTLHSAGADDAFVLKLSP